MNTKFIPKEETCKILKSDPYDISTRQSTRNKKILIQNLDIKPIRFHFNFKMKPID